MSDAKFTPGPWEAIETRGFQQRPVWGIAAGDGQWSDVAELDFSVSAKFSGEQIEANAHLISAAPDMYEALKASLARVNDLEIIINEARELGLTLFMCGDTWPQKKVAAEAAIAKAEGVQA